MKKDITERNRKLMNDLKDLFVKHGLNILEIKYEFLDGTEHFKSYKISRD